MNFKSFYNKIKSRINLSYVAITVVFLITALSAAAVFQNTRAQKYKYTLENNYVRVFTELTSHVDNIKNDLAKGVVATDARELSKLAGQIYSRSAAADSALGQLPVSDVSLANTSKFLAQVGDYTNRLSLRYIDDGSISEEEYATLLDFHRYAETLSATLSDMQSRLYSGEISFTDEAHGSSSSETTALAGGFDEIEGQFADYPSLIYDGPFSDHIQNASPALLEGKSEISADEATRRINEYTGLQMSLTGENNGALPAYCFSGTCADGSSVSAEITKTGGFLSWFLCDRAVYTTNLTIEDAKNAARSYIALSGLPNMRDTYYEIRNNTATINFASSENDIILYPDLVKIRVALDTGEILASEYHGYIMNHKIRNTPAFSHSEAEVLGRLSSKVTAVSVNKCLIPTESRGEIFCYEIRCGFDDKEFLIYLNSETLRQEDILMLLISEDGSLTV